MRELKEQVVVCLLIFLMPLGGSDCEFGIYKEGESCAPAKESRKKMYCWGGGVRPFLQTDTSEPEQTTSLE